MTRNADVWEELLKACDGFTGEVQLNVKEGVVLTYHWEPVIFSLEPPPDSNGLQPLDAVLTALDDVLHLEFTGPVNIRLHDGHVWEARARDQRIPEARRQGPWASRARQSS